MKKNFTKKIAKDIASKSFGQTLDCILGYSDAWFDLTSNRDAYEQDFIEDIEEKGFVVTDNRVDVIWNEFEKMRFKFIGDIRKKYYNEPTKD